MPPGRRQDRRDDRQDDRGPGRSGGGNNRYQMRQKMVTIGDDFWIENAQGQKVFKVDGKALRARSTLVLEDAHGNQLAKIQERKAHVKDSMEIEGPNGENLATVKKAMITPGRDRYTVKIKGGRDPDVTGNIVDHEFTVGEGRDKIAEISKKWFRVRDSYGVDIDPGQDDIVILALAICIDEMSH